MKNTLGIETILQILPANPGWRALFANAQIEGTREEPIAFWAVVKMEDGSTDIQGYVGGDLIESAEVFDGFLAYLGPGQE